MKLFLNDTDILFEKLAAYCLQEVTLSERIEIEAWIDTSKENREKFFLVQKLLKQREDAAPDIIVDVDNGWEALNAKILERAAYRKAKVRHVKWYMYAAACIIAVICMNSLFFLKSKAVDSWIVRTGFDTLKMADGTIITANRTAAVKYQKKFNKTSREVQLIGNAFFKVHRDTSMPFTIAFESGRVTVLGTQFLIEQQPAGFEVKVMEGKVKASLADTSRSVILRRGEMLKYNKVSDAFVMSEFATNEMLVYKNESLKTVLKDLYKAKGVLIHPDRMITSMQLTADFTVSSTEEILKALELLTGSELVKINENEYQLIKR